MRRSIPKLRTRATQDPRPEVEDVFTFWYCSCIFCCAIGYFCITVDEIVDYASPIVAKNKIRCKLTIKHHEDTSSSKLRFFTPP